VLSSKQNPAKPLRIMRQAGTPERAYSMALGAIERILAIAHARTLVPVEGLDIWRTPQYKSRTGLREEQSVDWYIEQSYTPSRCSVNGGVLIALMMDEVWQQEQPHYDICITRHPLWDNGHCFGTAVRGFGCVLSTYDIYQHYIGAQADDIFETLVMHEVGHMFGLVTNARTVAMTKHHDLHCTNKCVMRQGEHLTTWHAHTIDRHRGHVFCRQCRLDLQQHFRTQ
jgi:predicted Zn-dependent protease